MSKAAPHRIVIVGGGTAGWMAAAMLSRIVPRAIEVTLVESEAIGTIGVGEATIPQIRLLLGGLQLDEAKTLAAVGGTYKLGIEFDGWRAPGHRYMHAFGQVGGANGVVPFHQLWARGRALGIAQNLGDYIPTEVAALANRFDIARPGGPDLAHAYHIDAGLFAALLRRVAEAGGVQRVEGRIVAVERDREGGDVAALRLEGDRAVSGDLFIDCSGFRSLLLGETLGVGFESWSHWLPCDRALAVGSRRTAPLLPYTRATARAAGWQWRIPLQHRTGNGLVYSSARLSDDEATATLVDNLDAEPLGDPMPLRFEAGRRVRAWDRNVIAMGLAAGFLEPLESTSIHMVQSALARLIPLFPGRLVEPALRDAYNEQAALEWIGVRDFLILHYVANARDEPFWRERRATALPDGLAARIERFRATGVLLRDGEELFSEASWLQVKVGQGIAPRGWSPLAARMSDEELARFLAGIATGVAAMASKLPSHDETVARVCPMRK